MLSLCVAALFAGFVDSVVGGGGLIQTPALFLFLPTEAAASVAVVFGTNKLSSICGTGMAVAQYSRHVVLPWRTLLPAGLAACVFSFLGARVVSLFPPEMLKPAILVLLVLVTVYTAVRKDFGHLHAPKLGPGQEKLAALLTGAVLGFYDGFFGPGVGSFLIFAFVGIFGFDFLRATASAKVINLTTNLAALLYFASQGQVSYAHGLPMAACNVLGSLIGTRLAILKGNKFVRTLFLLIASLMILRFGWEVLF